MGLKGLNKKLQAMKSYLEKVVAEELPLNHETTYQLLKQSVSEVKRTQPAEQIVTQADLALDPATEDIGEPGSPATEDIGDPDSEPETELET